MQREGGFINFLCTGRGVMLIISELRWPVLTIYAQVGVMC